MRIAVGADHAGLPLKRMLSEQLQEQGHDVVDLGTHDPRPADYPDWAEAVGLAVLKGLAERGVVICGSGVGASIAANKLPGIRAGLCHDRYSARQGVEHDDMNVLVLGSRVVEFEDALDLVKAFLQADFSREDRHRRRVQKIRDLEIRYARP